MVIVGASLAGTRTAQALRDRGFDGELALIGAERHLPYDRPPLSKSVLGARSDPGIGLLSVEEIDALRIDVRIGQTATALRPAERKVELSAGEQLPYDALVVATGCAARMPVGWDRLGGRPLHVRRSISTRICARARGLGDAVGECVTHRKGTDAPSASWTSEGRVCISGVSNNPGALERGSGEGHANTAADRSAA